jgi:TPR repeat protein
MQTTTNGTGVERNEKKAKYYYELAAIRGNVPARYNLGISEEDAGNVNRAMKHWMISAAAGDDDSLKAIQQGYLAGHATKDDFEKALRAHKEAKDEMKSGQRDAAAAAKKYMRCTRHNEYEMHAARLLYLRRSEPC